MEEEEDHGLNTWTVHYDFEQNTSFHGTLVHSALDEFKISWKDNSANELAPYSLGSVTISVTSHQNQVKAGFMCPKIHDRSI